MMVGGGRASKKQIIDTEDKGLPSSAYEVLSYDDLLIEILLRLPAISLHLFKSVSKRWLSLITDPNFTLRRSQITNIDPPSGLFLQRPYVPYDYEFVPFDIRIPSNRSPINTTLAFGPDAGNFEILQSCNGLLLCYIVPDKFYVYNPFINLSKMLPQHRFTNLIGLIGGMKLAFDPIKSPHYTVVCAEDIHDDRGYFIQIQTYSSETGNWSVCGDRFPLQCFTGFHHGIYWNNAIHWLDFVNGGLHFKLDIEHPLLTRVQTPGTLDRKLHYVHKLLESRGRLLLVYPVLDSRQLKVYEMRNEYSGWLVKYIVNLDDMGKLFPKTWLISAKRFCIIVRSVVVGEREEDSYVVMEVSGKLIQYHIVLKTLRMIYGLASTCPPVSEAKKFGSFQFIASFAGV
ncbi:F-box protein At5g07610-like isoform X1 [Cynara cardunculus var. scolymus]|uniref:F-box protein At5g07610-like isoform X1 n=1 Tax=Cynara cardunculus var. scolymus TaxID=59895 RepID=UPI000D623EB6|nr:F-box protein At5g07610-like isoform X1 [Cynara cardunculus var. scolymus]